MSGLLILEVLSSPVPSSFYSVFPYALRAPVSRSTLLSWTQHSHAGLGILCASTRPTSLLVPLLSVKTKVLYGVVGASALLQQCFFIIQSPPLVRTYLCEVQGGAPPPPPPFEPNGPLGAPSCPPSDAHGTTGCVLTPWTARNNMGQSAMSPSHGRDGELWSRPRDKTPGPRRRPPRGGNGSGPRTERRVPSLRDPRDKDAGSPPRNRGRTCVRDQRNRTSGLGRLRSRPQDRTLGPHPRGRGGNSGWNPVGGSRVDPGQPSSSVSSGLSKPELFSLRALTHASPSSPRSGFSKACPATSVSEATGTGHQITPGLVHTSAAEDERNFPGLEAHP